MATHTASPEAAKRGHLKFERERMKQIKLALNDRTDADVIEFLEKVDNKRALILRLIREEMQRQKEAP